MAWQNTLRLPHPRSNTHSFCRYFCHGCDIRQSTVQSSSGRISCTVSTQGTFPHVRNSAEREKISSGVSIQPANTCINQPNHLLRYHHAIPQHPLITLRPHDPISPSLPAHLCYCILQYPGHRLDRAMGIMDGL